MQCPKCQSANVQLCSMAHEQGTSITKTEGSAVGGGSVYSPQGGFATTSHSTSLSSTSKTTTAFAQRAAPPKNWFGHWLAQAIGSAIAAVVIYFLHGLIAFLGVFEIVAVPWLLVSLVGLAITYPKREKYAENQSRWQASWICAACGSIFVPGESG